MYGHTRTYKKHTYIHTDSNARVQFAQQRASDARAALQIGKHIHVNMYNT